MSTARPLRPRRRRPPRRRGPGRPPQARAGEDVREQLLEAAGALFSRRAVGEVSLREVARAAGVTPAMVHYYFRDKEGLYDALLERALSRVLARVRGVLEQRGRAGDELSGLVEVVVGAVTAAPWIPPLMLREVLSPDGRFRERFIEIYASRVAELVPGLIQREVRAGRFRRDLDPDLAFASLLGMTAFPFLARPVLERVLGLSYDASFAERFAAHTRGLFLDGARARRKKGTRRTSGAASRPGRARRSTARETRR